jgi:hypothetical protein
MTQPWGSVPQAPQAPQAPPWRDPRGAPPTTLPVSGWAVAGMVLALVGFAVALLGAVFGLAALLGGGLVYAASTGEAGGTDAFVLVTLVGDLAAVLPLASAASICTALAWRSTRAGSRSSGMTVVSTVLSASLVLLGLLTLLVALF